jgi:glycosyltransferase involved in cell wall biosynthesis
MRNEKPVRKIQKITQLLAAAHTGDATGNQALILDRMFSELGYESKLYSLTIDKPLIKKVLPMESFKSDYNPLTDLLWYHFNLSSPLSAIFAEVSGKKLMQYHNYTPPEYFLPFNPLHSKNLNKAGDELRKLKDICDVALGVSNFNCSDLKKLGFRDPVLFPLIFETSIYDNNGSPSIERLLRGKIKNIIFVSRVAPNKKIEDLMACYAYIKKHIRDDCRLIIVGKCNHEDEYFRYLIRHIGQFRAEGILFTGEVTQEELTQYYRSANLFLSFSEHEGFFIPLLEAFYFGVPVVARDSAAVSETAGGAACLFEGRDVAQVTELAVEVLENSELRNSMIRKGRERLKDFTYDKAKTRLKALLVEI